MFPTANILLVIHQLVRVSAMVCKDTSTLTDQSGSLSSSSGNYLNNMNCVWRIIGEAESIIRLDIRYFNTECGYDYLYIHDGPSTASNRIGKLCGNRTSEQGYSMSIVSTSNNLYLEFTSDSYAVSSGFSINYSILPKGSYCNPLLTSACFGRGTCIDGSCKCNPGFRGSLCESQETLFANYTARKQHAVSYEATGDIMIMTFGLDGNGNSPLSDIFLYNFTTSSWLALPPPPSSLTPRFGHQQWFLNPSTLIIFGGFTDQLITPSIDIWTFDLVTNIWTRLASSKTPGAPNLKGAASVFVPSTNNSFSIYLFGGFDSRGYCSFALYRYSSTANNWIRLSVGPICFQFGTGIYSSPTNSLRFFGNDDSAYTGTAFTFEYSIESNWWSWKAPRSLTGTMLFGTAAVLDAKNEIAILHGGMNIGNFTECFLKTILILDIACNAWITMKPIVNLNRIQHGIFLRNNSLWILGGSDGTLFNDMLEIPLGDLTNELPNQTIRDQQCRAKSYCSALNDCIACASNSHCQWCNGACALNQIASPLETTINSSNNTVEGTLDTGICPLSLPIISTTNSCPQIIELRAGVTIQGNVTFQKYQDFYLYLGDFGDYYVQATISTLSKASLIMAFIDQVPYTPFSTSSTLKSGAVPLRPINNSPYTRIRVSWSNNAGIAVNDASTLPSATTNDSSLLNEIAFFSLTASINYTSKNDYDYSEWDYLQIAFATIGVFLITSIMISFRRFMQERQRRAQLLTGRVTPEPVVRHTPILYKYIAQVPNSNVAAPIPISVPFCKEEFHSSLSPDGPAMTATTLLVLMPTDHASYLSQGQLPPFSFGTHIQQTTQPTPPSRLDIAGRTSKGAKKMFEMIPMNFIKKSAIVQSP